MDTGDARAVRTAVVTGASSGIGRAVARAFGARGWRVALGARRADLLDEAAKEVDAEGGAPLAHPLDVADDASVDAFFDAVEDHFGPADVVVNSAGVAFPGPVHDVPVELHRRVLETNLLGPVLTTRRAVAALVTAGRPGDLVFISSDITTDTRPRLATYAASKAGLEHLAHTLALELEGTGIRSTVVRVGPTLTGFADGWDAEGFAELLDYWKRFGAHRHAGVNEPEDVARAVVQVVTTPLAAHIPLLDLRPAAPAG